MIAHSEVKEKSNFVFIFHVYYVWQGVFYGQHTPVCFSLSCFGSQGVHRWIY